MLSNIVVIVVLNATNWLYPPFPKKAGTGTILNKSNKHRTPFLSAEVPPPDQAGYDPFYFAQHQSVVDPGPAALDQPASKLAVGISLSF
jgi:hypothetical protein